MFFYVIINLPILIAFKGQLKIFIGKKHFSMLMLIKKVLLFNKTIVNICNFIPHKIVMCDNRDPPWMTRLIKKGLRIKIYFISAL